MGGEMGWFRRRGKLLIFRFTPRGLRRPRLETTRSSSISSSTASWNAFLCRGGNSDKARQLAADHPHGMQKRKPGRDLHPPSAPLRASIPERQSAPTAARKILARPTRGSCCAERFGLPANASSTHPAPFRSPSARGYRAASSSGRGLLGIHESSSTGDRAARPLAPLPDGIQSPARPPRCCRVAGPAATDKCG